MSIHFVRVCSLSLNSTDIIQDHDQIVKAICQRNPVSAHRLMDVHLRYIQPKLSEIQAAYPEYFK